MHLPSFHSFKTAKNFLSPVGHAVVPMAHRWHASTAFSLTRDREKTFVTSRAAMAHRWQYKYHIIGTSFVKTGTTTPKTCTTSLKSETTLAKTCTTFLKICTTFPIGCTTILKTCTTFLRTCTTFPKTCTTFLESLYHFSQKLFHFWQHWYQLYNICTVTYGPWLPIGDMKFFALAGERKRGEMHVTYGPWYFTLGQLVSEADMYTNGTSAGPSAQQLPGQGTNLLSLPAESYRAPPLHFRWMPALPPNYVLRSSPGSL